MDEEALTGGGSTVVIRVGGTVRRTAGLWTPTVHALLRQVRDRGLTDVPEPLGIDADGREILSYLPGEVPQHPMPAWVWSAQVLRDSGRLMRRLHDATVGFDTAGAVWQLPAHEPAEVICHNDLAPYNMVFRDGGVAGLIDFDTASPGPRLWDLAYLAYRIVPLTGSPDPTAPPASSRPERLDELLSAYGMTWPRAEVLATVRVRLAELAAVTERRAAATGRADLAEHAALYRRDAALLTGG
ncbi:phosphotransferase enzyme family protein [Cellulomonas hominis]